MAEKLTAAPWELPYPTSVGEVKLGAKDFEELAERTTAIFKEKVLIVKKYATSETLKSGELAVQEKSGETFTLPAVGTANQIIGIFSAALQINVTAAANIIGDGVNKASVKLAERQHVVLQSNGTNWMIVAGTIGGTVQTTVGSAPGFMSWGVVSEAGVLEVSSGDLTAAKTATGKYEIGFKTVKTAATYAVAANVFNAAFTLKVQVIERETSRFAVGISNSSDVATSSAWSFVVMATN